MNEEQKEAIRLLLKSLQDRTFTLQEAASLVPPRIILELLHEGQIIRQPDGFYDLERSSDLS